MFDIDLEWLAKEVKRRGEINIPAHWMRAADCEMLHLHYGITTVKEGSKAVLRPEEKKKEEK